MAIFIFSRKKPARGLKDRDYFCNRFLIVNVFDNLQYTSFQNVLNHWSLVHWFFQFFWNGDLHIFPQKKRTWSERSRLFCNRFLIVNVFDNLQYTSFQNVLNHWSLVHIKDSTHHVWKLPWTGMAKANSNYV